MHKAKHVNMRIAVIISLLTRVHHHTQIGSHSLYKLPGGKAFNLDVYIHVFLISALVGGRCSVSHPVRFTPGERATGTH
jgi:hypothetical protein